ncbi:NUDIX hydrolase [Caldimonas sp. KR1-144]|uniref:NUDIX hydrolase n=1 Tax=Caldimonas sp. KR1-144 TaxID=3400911 RepID=UPI003C0ED313
MSSLLNDRWRPSVTVAGVAERDGRFLLVEELTSEGLRLNNPAGHLEPGESLIDAVCREMLEETACRFTPTALLGVYLSRFHRAATGEDVTYLRFAFAGDVSEPEPGRALDEGIVRALWLAPDEIRTHATPHRSPLLWRCIEDHLAGRRFPIDLVWADPSLLEPIVLRPDR